MKTSSGLGAKNPQLMGKGKGTRVKAKASYVDESLFGSQARHHQDMGAEFDPPWVDNKAPAQKPLLWSPENKSSKTPPTVTTPRKRNKYRLKSHTLSYCDETLFGPTPRGQDSTAPWMVRCEVAKLRPLLCTPPLAPQDSPVLSSRPKEMPLRRAVHQEKPTLPGKEGFGAWDRGEDTFQKQHKSCPGVISQDVSRRPPSQSLTRLGSATNQFQSYAGQPRTSKQKGRLFPVTPTSSGSGHCTKGLSGSLSSRVPMVANLGKPKPPWK